MPEDNYIRIIGDCTSSWQRELYTKDTYLKVLQKGIDAKFIKGTTKDNHIHAWNQVKIGGKWFNVDLTWDREKYKDILDSKVPFILEVLRTDEEFKEHDKYELNRPSKEEKCTTKIKDLVKEHGLEI